MYRVSVLNLLTAPILLIASLALSNESVCSRLAAAKAVAALAAAPTAIPSGPKFLVASQIASPAADMLEPNLANPASPLINAEPNFLKLSTALVCAF